MSSEIWSHDRSSCVGVRKTVQSKGDTETIESTAAAREACSTLGCDCSSWSMNLLMWWVALPFNHSNTPTKPSKTSAILSLHHATRDSNLQSSCLNISRESAFTANIMRQPRECSNYTRVFPWKILRSAHRREALFGLFFLVSQQNLDSNDNCLIVLTTPWVSSRENLHRKRTQAMLIENSMKVPTVGLCYFPPF